MLYTLIFFFFLVQAILLDFYHLKVNKEWFWVLDFFVLVSLAGFRYKLGGDTFNYMRDFEDFSTLDQMRFEDFFGLKYAPLWVLFFSLIKTVFNDFVFFQLIHAIVINGVVFWFVNKYCKYRFLAMLFYFFYFYFYFNTEILRESLAIAFFLIAVPAYINEKWVRYYLLIFVSFLFHYSALILLLFPLIRNVKFNFRMMLIVGMVLYFAPKFILVFFPPFIKAYYEEYVVYQANIGGYVYATICFIIFPLLLLRLEKDSFFTKHQLQIFSSVFFSIAVYSFVSPSIALRFFNYLMPIAIIYFVDLSGDLILFTRLKKFLLLLVIPIVFLYKSKEYFADTSEILNGSRFYIRWYPYTSVFTKDFPYQKSEIDRREKWVDAHYTILIDDLRDLL